VEQKVEQKLEKKEEEMKEEKVHAGIHCHECQVKSIEGVRFACLDCDYNVCEVCEAKTEHPHDLLKIKKPRNRGKSLEMGYRQFKKATRKYMK